MEKILSVVIPSYNAAKYLLEDIPHFIDDRILDRIEIIIVNDGSKDNTLDVAKKFASKHPNCIQYIDKENGGHGSTINSGALVATGKYFKVVDADDWVDTDAFVDFVNYLDNVSSDLIIAPYTAVYKDSDLEVIHCSYQEFEEGKEYVFDSISEKITDYAMHAVTFKTEIIKQQPPISEHCFYVDMEYICNPIKNINSVSFFRKSVYQYRLGSAEQSVNIKNLQKNRDMHKQVTYKVLKLLSNKELSLSKRQFLERMVSAMIIFQTDILLSFTPNQETKRELERYYAEIAKVDSALIRKTHGKKVRLLSSIGTFMYWPLALFISRKG